MSTESRLKPHTATKICPTRVLRRGKCIRALLTNLESVLSIICLLCGSTYSDQRIGEPSSKVNGFIASLSDGSSLRSSSCNWPFNHEFYCKTTSKYISMH